MCERMTMQVGMALAGSRLTRKPSGISQTSAESGRVSRSEDVAAGKSGKGVLAHCIQWAVNEGPWEVRIRSRGAKAWSCAEVMASWRRRRLSIVCERWSGVPQAGAGALLHKTDRLTVRSRYVRACRNVRTVQQLRDLRSLVRGKWW